MPTIKNTYIFNGVTSGGTSVQSIPIDEFDPNDLYVGFLMTAPEVASCHIAPAPADWLVLAQQNSNVSNTVTTRGIYSNTGTMSTNVFTVNTGVNVPFTFIVYQVTQYDRPGNASTVIHNTGISSASYGSPASFSMPSTPITTDCLMLGLVTNNNGEILLNPASGDSRYSQLNTGTIPPTAVWYNTFKHDLLSGESIGTLNVSGPGAVNNSNRYLIAIPAGDLGTPIPSSGSNMVRDLLLLDNCC